MASLNDPRIERTTRHDLLEIIVIAICGISCGADSWVESAAFGQAKAAWLKQCLRLPNGIPSHDTFGGVFARLDPQAFQPCFLNGLRSLRPLTQGDSVAIDGKPRRRSFDRAAGPHARQLVSAGAGRNRLVLGQLTTDAPSNESTAIPPRRRRLEVAGCLVRIDAMGTQEQIAAALTTAGADDGLALNANPATAFEEGRLFLDDWATAHPAAETLDHDHGRLEVRRAWLADDIDWCPDNAAGAPLTSFGMVEAHRTLHGQTQTPRRDSLCSLPAKEVGRFAQAVRAHWQIDHTLPWSLDVTCREADSRVRNDPAPENLATLRRLALSLLKRETSRLRRHQGETSSCRLRS